MVKAYRMPKLAMAMNEGTVTEWLVEDGAFVELAQPLATVETEKVAYEVESPEAGYFRRMLEEGETVECDVVIGLFGDSLEELGEARLDEFSDLGDQAETPEVIDTASDSPSHEKNFPKRQKVSPAARKKATQSGIDVSTLEGTGPDGRVVLRDIETALVSLQDLPLPAGTVLARVPMTGMRGQIAGRMQQSLLAGAQLTANWESDITELLALKDNLPTRISVNSLLVRALVLAIREVPMANACFEGDSIILYESINVGIAISVEGDSTYDTGLKVGVLPNAESLTLVELDEQLKALIDRIRNNAADSKDLGGSTITLSSTAGIGPPGLMSTPILNSPNVALLGPSTPIKRPVVVGDDIAVRTLLPLSFTFDHRALDGEPAARFMRALHDVLEAPAGLLD